MALNENGRLLENSYKLPNRFNRLPKDELAHCLSDFEYLMGNYSQIIDKNAHTVPFAWNDFQKEFAQILLPMIRPETRLNRKHHVVVVKPRQVGATVFTTAFINLINAYVEGINNLGILHIMPVRGSVAGLARDKIEPIITGIHPSIAPTIYRKNVEGNIVYTYTDIKRAVRNNVYELASANSQAIRGKTKQIVLYDEAAHYRDPDSLEAALQPVVPNFGFALVVYLSTFEEKSAFFADKIQTAINNPEDYTLIFVPWYKIYPEAPLRLKLDYQKIDLTEYDKNVIIPEFERVGFPKDRWGDAIDWYHRTSAGFKRMKQEYPTTLEELLEAGKNEPVFSTSDIDFQRKYIEPDHFYRLSEDINTKKPELIPTDLSPLKIFRKPEYGRRYVLCVDPITSIGEKSDNFAATMMDMDSYQQVATLRGRELPLEDWAQYAVGLCKIYNNALICPEINVGGEFIAFVRGLGYHRFYYESAANQAKKIAGIRTTVGSKERMITMLKILLGSHRIILHDKAWVDELEHLETKTKKRLDGTVVYRVEAHKGFHDDCVMALAMFVGMLGETKVVGGKRSGWSIV